MSDLRPGRYRIISIGAGDRFTGVGPNRPVSLPVRIGGEINVWEIKPQPEPGFFRLSLGPFPYTGVVNSTVIATLEEHLDVNWQIKYHDDLKGFSIAERALWPTPAWSVTSDGEIKIKLYELYPGKDQLFLFEPVYD